MILLASLFSLYAVSYKLYRHDVYSCFYLGIGISCIGLALQMRVLQLALMQQTSPSAIYSGIFNAGIGAGALFGNKSLAILVANILDLAVQH